MNFLTRSLIPAGKSINIGIAEITTEQSLWFWHIFMNVAAPTLIILAITMPLIPWEVVRLIVGTLGIGFIPAAISFNYWFNQITSPNGTP